MLLGLGLGIKEVFIDGANDGSASLLGAILGIALCSDEGFGVLGCGA